MLNNPGFGNERFMHLIAKTNLLDKKVKDSFIDYHIFPPLAIFTLSFYLP